jgi:hypothetical protein
MSGGMLELYKASPAMLALLKNAYRAKEPFLTPRQQAALDDYWAAKTHQEEHWAYVRYLRAGGAPAWGETAEEAERIKNCPGCPPPLVADAIPGGIFNPVGSAEKRRETDQQAGPRPSPEPDHPDVPPSERGFGT